MSREVEHPQTVGGTIVDGIIAGLTGLVLSAILSAIIVWGLYANWAPFKIIEHNGIDNSFRLLSTEPHGSENKALGTSPAFQFVDVDLPACTNFAPDSANADVYCDTHNPITAKYLTAFADAPASDNIKVVLVDSELDLSREDYRKYVEHLIDSTQAPLATSSNTSPANKPWYVVPLPVRVMNPKADGHANQNIGYRLIEPLWLDPSWLKLHPLLTSRVRYAIFEASTDAEIGDGKIRDFSRVVELSTDSKTVLLPTAPYLAAELYRNTVQPGIRARLDCLYYGGVCPNLKAEYAANQGNPKASDPATQIIYAMPTLTEPKGRGVQPDQVAVAKARAKRFDKVYRRIPAGQLKDGANIKYSFFSAPPAKPTIVVIGTSLPSAFDLHLTPVGNMAGSEILINATQTQFQFPEVERSMADKGKGKEYLALFKEKMFGMLLPAFILTIAYVVLNLFAFWARKAWPVWNSSSLVRAWISIAFIGAVLVGCLVLELRETLSRLFENASTGRVIDTLTPIVGLGFEFYTDVGKCLLMMIEAWLLGAWEIVSARSMAMFKKELP